MSLIAGQNAHFMSETSIDDVILLWRLREALCIRRVMVSLTDRSANNERLAKKQLAQQATGANA